MNNYSSQVTSRTFWAVTRMLKTSRYVQAVTSHPNAQEKMSKSYELQIRICMCSKYNVHHAV